MKKESVIIIIRIQNNKFEKHEKTPAGCGCFY